MKEGPQHGGLLNEQTGIDRIREALQAHTWPSMNMKHKNTILASSSSEAENKAVNEPAKKDKKNLDSQSREIIGKRVLQQCISTVYL